MRVVDIQLWRVKDFRHTELSARIPINPCHTEKTLPLFFAF